MAAAPVVSGSTGKPFPITLREEEERSTKKVKNKQIEVGSLNSNTISPMSFKDTVDNVPTITFSDRVRKEMAQAMDGTIMVRLLGKTLSFQTMADRLRLLWKPVGRMRVTDAENGYFMVRFDLTNDCLKAFLDGPWIILGHYLLVQPYSLDFNAKEVKVSSVAAWIQFSGLPFTTVIRTFYVRFLKKWENLSRLTTTLLIHKEVILQGWRSSWIYASLSFGESSLMTSLEPSNMKDSHSYVINVQGMGM
ncbi:hypothetical protein Scep_028020 [Stephania cephalantha]|uniref:DUF4283 domain-containing protein n=1 Tax=Stephania cephalantha TaxID=152367 RepID=A0AAP0ECI6_9MAGN